MSSYLWQVDLHPQTMRDIRKYQHAQRNFWRTAVRKGSRNRMKYWSRQTRRLANRAHRTAKRNGCPIQISYFHNE